MFGPKTRAIDWVIVSTAALAAQYAILLPAPVNADTEEILITTASCEAFKNGITARMTA